MAIFILGINTPEGVRVSNLQFPDQRGAGGGLVDASHRGRLLKQRINEKASGDASRYSLNYTQHLFIKHSREQPNPKLICFPENNLILSFDAR